MAGSSIILLRISGKISITIIAAVMRIRLVPLTELINMER
jgi:hypothetical protein